MTPAGELLAAEIRRNGPIPFRRFMEVALYHPEHGYYRRARDPFGKARRLLHGGTDPAGLRHPDGGADSPALPRRWANRATSPWSNWARGAARWRRHSPSGTTCRWISIPVRCPRTSSVLFSPTSSSTRFRWMPRCTATAPSTNSGSRWRTARSAGTPAKWLETPRNVTCAATTCRPRKAAGTK